MLMRTSRHRRAVYHLEQELTVKDTQLNMLRYKLEQTNSIIDTLAGAGAESEINYLRELVDKLTAVHDIVEASTEASSHFDHAAENMRQAAKAMMAPDSRLVTEDEQLDAMDDDIVWLSIEE